MLKLGYEAAELDADDLDGTELLKKKGMQVSSIYRNYRWKDEIDTECMEDHIRIAKRLGASRIMAIPGLHSGSADDKKRELENMHEGMRKLSSLATDNGLMLTIEDYDKEDDLCLLGYPNEEVEYAFMNKLLDEFSYLEDPVVNLLGSVWRS